MSVKEGNKLDTYRTFSGVSAKVFPGMYVILLCIIILANKENICCDLATRQSFILGIFAG